MEFLERHPFLNLFWKTLESSEYGVRMKVTVENSPWHRESSVWRHTEMCLEVYVKEFAHARTEREVVLTCVALMAHDIGKPEAEETLERKDGSGEYRTYAGHEPVSANEFLSFMCDNHVLRSMFFEQGYDWHDVRKIKFMIEHHLPYGLKNPTKRGDLRQAIALTMEDEEESFWDMLRSDSRGRVSDDHEQKLANVEEFIAVFRDIPFKKVDTKLRLIQRIMPFEVTVHQHGLTMDHSKETGLRIAEPRQKTVFMLMGVSGAGKSTWVESLKGNFVVFNEDDLRMKYAKAHVDEYEKTLSTGLTDAGRYNASWHFCHMNPESKFEQLSKEMWGDAVASGLNIVLDRMNQGKKGRGKFINVAKQQGYKIHSVEFFISEATAKARQRTRGDKMLPDYRVHQIYMQQEVPWLGPEVDGFEIIAP